MQCSKQPVNLGAFGQVLGSLTDYNLASADEDDLSVLVTLSRLTQTVCALRSVHFTHDAIAGAFPCPDWVELNVRKRITLE
jgi:hypothetical protein